MSGYTDLLIAQYATKPQALATIQALADDMAKSFTGARLAAMVPNHFRISAVFPQRAALPVARACCLPLFS
jgi:hypothetical protein